MKNNAALKAGITGALAGMLFSALLNYFVIPIPETTFINAVGNGMSGLISGFMGGFMALKAFQKNP
ncbi:MAG: hypothetical protein AAF734_10630 [Bacteroidota bacterium]